MISARQRIVLVAAVVALAALSVGVVFALRRSTGPAGDDRIFTCKCEVASGGPTKEYKTYVGCQTASCTAEDVCDQLGKESELPCVVGAPARSPTNDPLDVEACARKHILPCRR